MHIRRSAGSWIAALVVVLLASGMFGLLAPPARATPIGIGATVPAVPDLLGPSTLVASTSGTVNTLFFNAFVRENVYKGTNIYGVDKLTWALQVTDLTPPAEKSGLIEHATIASFNGFNVSVGYQLLSSFDGFVNGNRAPDDVNRSFLDGAVISFNFDTATTFLSPGDTSYLLLAATDATNFKVGSVGVIDGGAGELLAFAPDVVRGVPEPDTYLVFGAGFLGLAFMMRRKRQTAAAV